MTATVVTTSAALSKKNHRGCPLAAFTVDVAIQDAPGRLSHTCTRQGRGKHRDHTQEAVVSQQWSAGSSSTHSPALSTTCFSLLRGQKVANYHSKGNSTLSRRTATWCCSLAPLVPPTGLATCAWIWQYMMHEQDASAHLVPSCNAGKGG